MSAYDDDEMAVAIERAGRTIANAIKAGDTGGGYDDAGGYVASLTEAVMGVTRGLCQIASALESVAEAIRESRP